jgi:hypothetical protein
LRFVGGYAARWTPDSRYVAIWGREGDTDDRLGYFAVNVATGKTKLLVRPGGSPPAFSQYSQDGRRFFYLDPVRGIVERDLGDGTEVVALAKGSHGDFGPFMISPDMQTLAYTWHIGEGRERVTTVGVRPLDRPDAAPLELARATAPLRVSFQAWTPDSDYVLYSETQGSNPYTLWKVPAQGGERVDMHFSMLPQPNPISLSPDGKSIAYTERTLQPELWISPLKLSLKKR